MKTFYVYMMTNQSRVVLYTGVTNDLKRRVWEHQRGEVKGFTKRYRCNRLVYYEDFHDIRDAIAREKQIKGWVRAKKDALVESLNPAWVELSRTLFEPWRGPSPSARFRMTGQGRADAPGEESAHAPSEESAI